MDIKDKIIAGLLMLAVLAISHGAVLWKGYDLGIEHQKAVVALAVKKTDDTKIAIKGKQDEISNNRPSVVRVVGRLRRSTF